MSFTVTYTPEYPARRDLNVMLTDFEGVLESNDGNRLQEGLSLEDPKSPMPQVPVGYASVKTDLFALGSAISFVMTGHGVFPELDSAAIEEILSPFQIGLFPTDNHDCIHITEKCWKQQYESADEVVSDMPLIQASQTIRNTEI